MKERYSKATKDILLYLATIGAIAVAATSPYFFFNIAEQIWRKRRIIKEEIQKEKLKMAIKRLRKNRLIILKRKNGKFIIALTEKGKRKVKEIQLENLKIKKPKKWDKKWRGVIFDIPNSKNRERNILREKLKRLNFYPLQKSVWICPYPCEKEIQFLIEYLRIRDYVNIFTMETIFDDIELRKYFKLF